MTSIIKLVAVLAAAGMLGNWFLAEFRKARRAGAPWYRPYLSPPGLLIVLAMLLPMLYRYFSR